jgi:hypothetical protein
MTTPENHRLNKSAPSTYWSPYVAGVGLGLTLLTAIVLMGRGLGASGAFTSMVTAAVNAVAPGHAAANGMFSAYLGDGTHSPLRDWLVFEILGMLIGGYFSARLAGRVRIGLSKGSQITGNQRVVAAFIGGILMGFAAKLARGCTSGLALTGAAVMSVGGWLFMLSVFAGGFLAAFAVRRLWT